MSDTDWLEPLDRRIEEVRREIKLSTMKQLKTTVTFTAHSDYGDLENYPASGTQTITFDATDCTIQAYVEQFRCFLKAEGFAEKTIKEALGEY